MPTRRKFLGAAMVAGTTGLAGCGADGQGETPTPRVEQETVVKTKIIEKTPEPESDETYEKVGPFTFTGWTRGVYEEFYLVQRVASQAMARLGFTINHEAQPVSGLVDGLQNRGLTLFNSAQIGDMTDTDPVRATGAFYSGNTKGQGAGNNYSEYENDDFNRFFEQYRRAIEPAERITNAKECVKITARDQPYMWTHIPDVLAAHNTNQFTGWTPGPFGYPYFTWDNWMNLEPVGNNRTVSWATTLEPNQINFMSLTDAIQNLIVNMLYHDKLTFINSDFESIPWAAESWEVTNGGEVIDFKLRDGLQFHDGEPVTAEDVKFTMDYLLEWNVPYVAPFYASVSGSEVLDERNVRINFSEPDGAFLTSGAPRLTILPKHIWEGVVEEEGLGHPGEWNDDDAYIGAGPLKITNIDQGSSIVFEPHEDHPITGGELDFDQFIWHIYGNAASAVGATENNDATFMVNLSPSQFDRLDGAEGVEAISIPSITTGLIIAPAGNPDVWQDDVDTRPWIDPAMHLAAAWAIDKEDLVNVVLRGFGEPCYSMMPGRHQMGVADEDLPVTPGGDLQKAKQILADAGYRWDESGQLLMPKSRLDELEQEMAGDGRINHPDWVPDSAY